MEPSWWVHCIGIAVLTTCSCGVDESQAERLPAQRLTSYPTSIPDAHKGDSKTLVIQALDGADNPVQGVRIMVVTSDLDRITINDPAPASDGVAVAPTANMSLGGIRVGGALTVSLRVADGAAPGRVYVLAAMDSKPDPDAGVDPELIIRVPIDIDTAQSADAGPDAPDASPGVTGGDQ